MALSVSWVGLAGALSVVAACASAPAGHKLQDVASASVPPAASVATAEIDPELRAGPDPLDPGPEEIAVALETLNALQKSSIKLSREYCGFIGVNSDKEVVATPAAMGTESTCSMPPRPPGLKIVATYHTHGSYSPRYDNEVPSYQDLWTDIEAGVDGYVSTPGGRLWLTDASEEATTLLCDAGCLLTDPRLARAPVEKIAESYTLKDLARR